jgi:hypothetical protein
LATVPVANWRTFCKTGLVAIWDAYMKYKVRYRKQMGKEAKLANFVKSQEHLGKFIERPPWRHFLQQAKGLLR